MGATLATRRCRISRWVFQMVASWQKANFVEDQSGEMQRTVYVNMDETMIRLWQGGRRDLVKVEPFADRKLFSTGKSVAPSQSGGRIAP